MSDQEVAVAQRRHGLTCCLEKAESARSYAKRKKRHTALIIVCSIVEFVKANIDACVADTSERAKKEFLQLVEETQDSLRLQCKRADDVRTIAETKTEFEKLLAEKLQKGEDADDSTSDGTECSCDDCHNHTCSTNGPLGGCRRARTRD